MKFPRNDAQAEKIKKLYDSGLSLAKIGIEIGITRQAVFKILKCRDFSLRSNPIGKIIVWNGRRYSLRPHGYFALTSGKRSYLHRDMWEQEYGKIPDGFEIHHKDENKENNVLSNFELLSCSEHGATHGFGGNQYVPSLGCRPVKNVR